MSEPTWLSPALVRALHLQLMAEHGGDAAIRDAGLLESAVARAQQAWEYGERQLHVLAAKTGQALAINHPFVDGNKRIALAAVDVFLRLNGHELTASEEEAYLGIMDLARGDLDEVALADWIRKWSAPSPSS